MKQKPSILIQIVHINGPLRGEIQEFDGAQVTVGRHPQCDVVFPKDQTFISRRHAVIKREGNLFKLIDESANGTFVNGKPIQEVQLRSGDVITVGEGGPKISFLTQVGKTADVLPSAEIPLSPVREMEPVPEPKTNEFQPGAAPSRKQRKSGGNQVPSPSATPWEPSPSAEVSTPSPPLDEPVEIPVVAVQQPLVIQYGPRLETFKTLPITMGRGTDCDFTIDQADLCEHHAQIFFHQDQYWIKDLSGRNLVLLNGKAIQQQAPLLPQTQLSLGVQGPHFSFLGEGRLAEATVPVPVENQTDSPDGHKDAALQENKPGKFSHFMRRISKKE